MSKVIEINNLSKVYDLGLVGTGTLSKDLNRSWAKLRGKPDPYATLVEMNDRTKKSSSNMVYALKDINFSVEQGEVLGIIGKNGAGKSTLLKILSQITSPSTGSIKMKGRVASLLEVGTGMHPEMTARQNIHLNGSLMGMGRREITSKLDEIVDFAGIEKYIDTPIKRFSSGMQVRLGFAVAAFLEPEILIVDEVLAVGDVEFQKKAIGKMRDVSQGEGRTVLFVSHNMVSVENLCQNSVVLENGRVVFSGTANEGVEYYLDGNSKNVELELKDRKDREGNGKIKVNKILVFNENGLEVSQLNTGKAYEIRFEFCCHEILDSDLSSFIVQIKNDKDEAMSYIASDELGLDLGAISKDGYFSIKIEKLQLRAGKYFCNYRVSEKKAQNESHSNVDYLQNAFELNVETGDYWNVGILNRPKGFIQNAEMKIVQNN